MHEALELESFKVWLSQRIPAPESLMHEIEAQTFSFQKLGVQASTLLALNKIKLVFPMENVWEKMQSQYLKKTLESLPFWHENLEVASWLAPLAIMALTADMN